jgi:hypothetical protein
VRRRTRWITGGALVALLTAAGTGTGMAASGREDDRPLSGSTLDRAVEAALRATGPGTVTETEAGDDGAAYSVEVRLRDGRHVEVNLDPSFEVTGQETDDDGAGDGTGDD